jgi:hypothetical protein
MMKTLEGGCSDCGASIHQRKGAESRCRRENVRTGGNFMKIEVFVNTPAQVLFCKNIAARSRATAIKSSYSLVITKRP